MPLLLPHQRKRASSSRSGSGANESDNNNNNNDDDYYGPLVHVRKRHCKYGGSERRSSSSSSSCRSRSLNLVYVANVAEYVDDESLKEFCIENFQLAYKKDLKIVRCIVRGLEHGFSDAVVECQHEEECRLLLRLKNRTFSGNTMEFIAWSSERGDISNFSSRTQQHQYPQPNYFTDNVYDTDVGRGGGVSEEEKKHAHDTFFLHITNVVDATCDRQLRQFLEMKFKSAFKCDLKLVRCHFRQSDSDAFVECKNKMDCRWLLQLKSRMYNHHEIVIARTSAVAAAAGLGAALGTAIMPLINDNNNDDNDNTTFDMTTHATISKNDEYAATELRGNNDDDDDDTQKLQDDETAKQKIDFVVNNVPDKPTNGIPNCGKHRDDNENENDDVDIDDDPPDTTIVQLSNDDEQHATLLKDHNALSQNYEYAMKQNIELTAKIKDWKAKQEETLSKYKHLKRKLFSSHHAEERIESLKQQAAESEQRCNKLTDTIAKQTDTICDVMQEKREVISRLEVKVSMARQEAERVFDREKKSKLEQEFDRELRKQSIELEQKFDRDKSEVSNQFERRFDEEKEEFRKQLQNEFDQEKIKLRNRMQKEFDQDKIKLRNQIQKEVDAENNEFRDQMQDDFDREKKSKLEQYFDRELHKQLQELRQKFDLETSKVSNQFEQRFDEEKEELRKQLQKEFDQEKIKLRNRIQKEIDQEKINLRNQVQKEFDAENNELRDQMQDDFDREKKCYLVTSHNT